MDDGHGYTNETLLGQQADRESSARTYPRGLPMAIDRAEGVELVDVDGNRYYDCLAGAGTLALGHNHPVAVDAMRETLDAKRPLHTLDITTPVKERFVDALFDSLPDEFADRAKVQFCSPAGTDAVEAATKLVKTATGNRSLLAFQGAYHGMTHGSLSLTGDTAAKEPIPNLMGDVHHLPYPYDYRPPLGLGGEAGEDAILRRIEEVIENPESGVTDPAGLFVEPVQGEGGTLPPSDDWLRGVRRITREHDVPLVVDEIQAGLGRCGTTYAFERAGITPDVVTLSKAVGGGLPLAVVLYDERLDAWEAGAHTGTFRGNQLGMAAGRATIEYIVDEDLPGHAADVGERFLDRLEGIGEGRDAVGDVRGRGLMLGVELVDADAEPNEYGARPTDAALAERVRSACFDRGVVVELGGRDGSTVRFLPPLVIEREQVDEVCDVFAEALDAATA
ncbi:diaminobutyrate--2-oxoglutarate transaminase [Candidatus Halobonum tyrrellensis]|uniref:2,4-diaminobutyrate 4-transaminase n=1 Tax=Candidatus Halobonum tyrrellensis G22 TaxID=1324957 RepID=V4GQR1_9EURY|nr:diaminobutyrate--2-oxoglutarate transaminase [Candidatus Halobonum tyrrellensis]ESP87376.1 2,4-diaminobutyrate 4-transaminase [Candidatus Halobonum tyrrellensis G22]